MEIDKWIGSYKVRSFSWIDGKRIYFGLEELVVGRKESEVEHDA